MHVYRWDLDKTYLATDIHSVRGLVRAALEGASEKRNVPGSATLLRGLIEHDADARVAVLSGSPTQMRAVLEEKLALDGVRVDSLVLKDNLGNMRRGRIRAIRGQVGYKLPSLLRQRIGVDPDARETLFGDDSEVDALIYTLYAEALAGRVNERELARVMDAAGAYDDSVDAARAALRQVPRADAVEDIFIHVEQGVSLASFHLLGARVIPVFSWLQAALVLWLRSRLGAHDVVHVTRACMDEAALDGVSVASLVQDLVRRRHLAPADVARLVDTTPGLAPIAPAIRRAVERLGPPPSRPSPPVRPDFLGFLRAR